MEDGFPDEIIETASDAFDLAIQEAIRATTPKRRAIKLAKAKPARSKRLPLTIEQILAWADARYAATGVWPKDTSGPIKGAEPRTWHSVQSALQQGLCGLPAGNTLPRLLAKHREVRHHLMLPALATTTILEWADHHRTQTGDWPHFSSGPVLAVPQETWSGINAALNVGLRSLPGGFSLADLLADQRGVRNRLKLPPLSKEQILQWADAYKERHGNWPDRLSGSIEGSPEETWTAIDINLYRGRRGLPGGSSLSHLLAEFRGAPYKHDQEPFTIPQILAWADAWHFQHGKWPKEKSGPVYEGSHTTWLAVKNALTSGRRGLPGGSSLPRLLTEFRGVPNHLALPSLTREQILVWANLHRERTGQFPTRGSGAIIDAPGETWSAVNSSLVDGCRSLSPGSSLSKLLAEHRDNTPKPPFTDREKPA